MAPFAERLASARTIADGRRIVATDIEARLGKGTAPARAGQAARRLGRARRGAHSAARLAGMRAPAWLYLPAAENTLSATLLRRAGTRPHKAAENASQGARS